MKEILRDNRIKNIINREKLEPVVFYSENDLRNNMKIKLTYGVREWGAVQEF